jgi:hypothetical protein
MKHTHTPGPWHITDEGSQIVVQTFSDHPTGTLARIYRVDKSAYSDARLISAAPDLLASLEDAEFLLRKAGLMAGPMRDSFNRSAGDARAAIAKATGKGQA